MSFARLRSLPVADRQTPALPPEIAVEVLSPDDKPKNVKSKREDFLQSSICSNNSERDDPAAGRDDLHVDDAQGIDRAVTQVADRSVHVGDAVARFEARGFVDVSERVDLGLQVRDACQQIRASDMFPA